ncbi:hypothetical protein B0E41_08655 [Hydrogenophaga sp. A37]|nr:hypothetical protein B0E41_08655 [Hydrogenophaga sp. A37]
MREESKLYEQGRAISHMLLLEACVTVAALMQKKRSREICEKDLLAAIEIYPVLNDLQYIEFGGRSLLNRTCEGDYRFSHYAIQEFIMAYGLIENLIANRLRPLPYSENLLSFILNGSDKTFKLLSIDFSNVEYQGAKFEGIDFSSVSFSGATLFHTTFKNCTLAGCNFSRSVFSGSIDNTCYENLDFSGCDFTESSLALTHFKNCNFKNCRFANAKLEGGAFINCNFDYSDFTSSSLTASNMSYSSFRQCTFVKANVLGLKVDKSLMQSDYSKADNADKICIMVRY